VLFDNPDSGGASGESILAAQAETTLPPAAHTMTSTVQLPAEFDEFLADEITADYFDDEHTIIIGKDGVPVMPNATGNDSAGIMGEGTAGGKPETTGGMASVGFRTATYKYVEYKNGDQELYDLVNDPLETINQVVNAAPALLTVLSVQLAQLQSCAGETCRQADMLVPRAVFPLTDDWVTPTGTPTSAIPPTSTATPTAEVTATGTPVVTPSVIATVTGTPSSTQPSTATVTPELTATDPAESATATLTVTVIPAPLLPTVTVLPTPTLLFTATPSPTPDNVGGEGTEEFRLYLPLIG
jgi:hypothetical protein